MHALAGRYGQSLVIAELRVEPLSGAEVRGLRLTTAGSTEPAWLEVPQLHVGWQVAGLSAPRLHLRQVRVEGGRLRLRRRADGSLALQPLLDRLRGGAEAPASVGGEGEGGGLRRWLGPTLPAIDVRGARLEVDDEGGAPLRIAGGADLRHLRATLSSASLRNHSPVTDRHDLHAEARVEVEGLQAPLELSAALRLPERRGRLRLRSVQPIRARVGGFDVSLGGLEIDEALQLRAHDLSVAEADAKTDASSSIDVRRVALGLTWPPRSEEAIPAALRDRLPAPALLALRHVRTVELEDPVWIGRRPEARKADPRAAAADAEEPEVLLPRASAATEGEATIPAAPAAKPADAGRAGRRSAAAQAPEDGDEGDEEDDDDGDSDNDSDEDGRGAAGGHVAGEAAERRGGTNGVKAPRKSAATVRAETKAARAAAEPGAKVRAALAALAEGGARRLEGGLGRLRTALGALPFERVTLVNGRARFHDERPRAVSAGEVSNFAARIERATDGAIELEVSFAAQPGQAAAAGVGSDAAKAANTIRGRVLPATGDASLDVHLDRLPLAPWGAVLPRALRVHPDSLLRDTQIQLRYDAKARTIGLEGKGEVAHFDLLAPRLARNLIPNLVVRGSGKLLLDLGQDKVAATGVEIGIGRASAMIDAKVENARSAPVIDLKIQVPTLACQDAVDSLVGPIAPMLAGARCGGTLAFRVDVGLDTAKMASLKLEFEPTLRNVEIESMGRYIDFDVLRGPFEQHARQRDGSLYTFVTGPGSSRWVSLPEISPNMVAVVTTTEDGSFFWHRGFSLQAIRDSMVANLNEGRFVRGASTISQQVVKNLFFVEREKTVSRKIQEAVVTWELERRFQKEEILALYFNIIELGPKIYGIREAVRTYFQRSPLELTLLQAIWLGSIIPSPRGHYHHYAKGQVSEVWRTHLCWVADVMLKREKITADERARLGTCEVVFGGGIDGSEAPPDAGLGHEYEGWDADAPPPPPQPSLDQPPPPPPLEGRRVAPDPQPDPLDQR